MLIRRYGERLSFSPIYLYAVTELLIGVSALIVPLQLLYGHHLLTAQQSALSSGTYYLRLLSREMTPDQMIVLSPNTPALQDDRPINEYYKLRHKKKARANQDARISQLDLW